MNSIQYRLRPRLGDTADPTYEVSARIVSQEGIDGQPIDTPIQMATDQNGTGTGSSFDAQQQAAAQRAQDIAAAPGGATPGNTASSPTGATAGGRGSGGIYPGAGLPGAIPNPLAWLAAALILGGCAFVVIEGRK